MAAALATSKTHCRSTLPEINLFDVPELMPGAHSSATPAERLDFEQRCIQLYADDVEEQYAQAVPPATAHMATAATVDELEVMFPKLDAGLVRALAADAGNLQQAMETLLALSEATAEPQGPAPALKDIGLQDTDAFPSLVDADGWEVVSQRLFDRDLEEDLGSAWRDRAKAIASKPAPPAAPGKASVHAKKRAAKQDNGSNLEALQPETEYELRQRLGQQRIQNRMRFPGPKRGAAQTATDVDCRFSEASSFDAIAEFDEAADIDEIVQ